MAGDVKSNESVATFEKLLCFEPMALLDYEDGSD